MIERDVQASATLIFDAWNTYGFDCTVLDWQFILLTCPVVNHCHRVGVFRRDISGLTFVVELLLSYARLLLSLIDNSVLLIDVLLLFLLFCFQLTSIIRLGPRSISARGCLGDRSPTEVRLDARWWHIIVSPGSRVQMVSSKSSRESSWHLLVVCSDIPVIQRIRQVRLRDLAFLVGWSLSLLERTRPLFNSATRFAVAKVVLCCLIFLHNLVQSVLRHETIVIGTCCRTWDLLADRIPVRPLSPCWVLRDNTQFLFNFDSRAIFAVLPTVNFIIEDHFLFSWPIAVALTDDVSHCLDSFGDFWLPWFHEIMVKSALELIWNTFIFSLETISFISKMLSPGLSKCWLMLVFNVSGAFWTVFTCTLH